MHPDNVQDCQDVTAYSRVFMDIAKLSSHEV